MLIGVASARSGASIRAIRLYESLGIIDAPLRRGRYRVYSLQHVETLRCIKQAQRLGFSLKDISGLRTVGQTGLDAQRFGEAIDARKTRLAMLMSSLQLQMQALEVLQREASNPAFCQRGPAVADNQCPSEACEPT